MSSIFSGDKIIRKTFFDTIYYTMKKLFTENDYELAKSDILLPLACYYCNNTFYIKKKFIKREITKNLGHLKFCDLNCMAANNTKEKVLLYCLQCNKQITRNKILVSDNIKSFCSRSCSVTYRNINKEYGLRRSKLEKFLEKRLSEIYPNLILEFNNKTAIKSELDIYIPSLSLAFELNGIFHYEPIYGTEKLNQIQNNDNRKYQACIENNISLCIIDTSQQKYFKESNSQKYLDIIKNIINQKLLTS